jgi:hypothetical protein
MKGVIFSADFIKDSNGDLRLLELNTDTGIIEEQIQYVDWSSLIDVVYKPVHHKAIVNHLSSSIADSNVSLTSFNLHDVEDNHNFFANQLLVHNRCFIAGTEITLADGNVRKIELVSIGDEVLTFNEETGQQEPGVVGDLKEHQVSSVIKLTFDNDKIIFTTHEHPFFVKDKGWVKAAELEKFDACRKVNGQDAIVSSVEVIEEIYTVYNLLSVSNNHNFYANEILVHNK